MKLTRRELAAAALAPAALAQDPPAPPVADKELEAARQSVRKYGEALTRYKIPMETEPAFQFKP